VHLPGADAIDECLFAAIALDHPGRQRLELMRRDDVATMGSRGIEARLLRSAVRRCRGLCNAEGIGPVRGDLDPGQRGNRQALCRTAVGAVPEPSATMGPLPACGDTTRVDGQDVLVAGHDNLDKGSPVEADEITVALTPSSQGCLMVRTLTTQLTKRHAAWQHQQQTPHVTQKLLWRFLCLFQAHQYTLKQPHGAFS
jgi:hypothetical protein